MAGTLPDPAGQIFDTFLLSERNFSDFHALPWLQEVTVLAMGGNLHGIGLDLIESMCVAGHFLQVPTFFGWICHESVRELLKHLNCLIPISCLKLLFGGQFRRMQLQKMGLIGEEWPTASIRET